MSEPTPSTGQSFEDSLYLSEREREFYYLSEQARVLYQVSQRLSEKLNKAHNLIRWLGRAYGDNEPIWAFNDAYGHELEANRELHRTWQQVMGTRLEDNPQETTEPGETPRPNESESSTNE